MGLLGKLSHIYDKHYMKFMAFSFILLFACMAILAQSYVTTGEFFERGVSLKGGITLTVPINKEIDIVEIEQALQSEYTQGDFAIRKIAEGGRTKSLIIEASDVEMEQLEKSLPKLGIPLVKGEYSAESMGSALSGRFFAQTIKALIFAFIAMAIVVFITFRSLVPSSFVILAAVSDIISTLAAINLLGVRLSIAGIAAFLMLIGYSVDTDILLTTKVLKRKSEGGTTFERTVGALKTGIVITVAALAAAITGLIFSESETVKQIMLVIAIGLSFDTIYTWFQNAGILRYYIERKERKTEGKEEIKATAEEKNG